MSVDQEMLSREAEQLVRDMGIPPCPAVLAKLVQKMRDDDPDPAQISGLISSDVGLSAAILKTVNSSFFGLRTKATSIQQALALLGLSNVAQLVTGLLLRQAFATGASSKLEQFWDASSSLALVSAYVAREFRATDRDAAYTFALFRDCGIPVMIGKFRDYVPHRGAPPAAGADGVTDQETARYGTNHTVIGYCLAKSWMLPDETCQAILRHHDLTAIWAGEEGLLPGARRLVAVSLVSEWLLAKCAMEPASAGWNVGGTAALAEIKIGQAELDAIVPEIQREIEAGRKNGAR